MFGSHIETELTNNIETINVLRLNITRDWIDYLFKDLFVD